MRKTQWYQFLELFAEKNQHLTKEQVLQQAKKPFQQIKEYYEQRGGTRKQNLNNPDDYLTDAQFLKKYEDTEDKDLTDAQFWRKYENTKDNKLTDAQFLRKYENIEIDFLRQAGNRIK